MEKRIAYRIFVEKSEERDPCEDLDAGGRTY
jgi:hypothetical protein